jgi:hypothetical protein
MARKIGTSQPGLDHGSLDCRFSVTFSVYREKSFCNSTKVTGLNFYFNCNKVGSANWELYCNIKQISVDSDNNISLY